MDSKPASPDLESRAVDREAIAQALATLAPIYPRLVDRKELCKALVGDALNSLTAALELI
jgi:hypothetical protein